MQEGLAWDRVVVPARWLKFWQKKELSKLFTNSKMPAAPADHQHIISKQATSKRIVAIIQLFSCKISQH
jgi:hypothetical protein